MTMLTDAQLLQRIEAFLARTGMAPTRFGRDAMAEASLIKSLREGRSLSLKSANKVLGFMVSYEREAGLEHVVSDSEAPMPLDAATADKLSEQVAA